MSLAESPAWLILLGLAAYSVLAGADFGAGVWQLWPGRVERDFAHHAMGPVWEANHVWLIFILVVAWTAYPTAFGSIASTLCVPLFIAGLGIIMRGTAYALRSGTADGREQRTVEVVFALSSILTPFALGTVIGGIASGRVPVGNAAGDRWTSWLNSTSITIGLLAVAFSAYLAAVYLAADAVRARRTELAEAFRVRALAAAVVAGAAAFAGLVAVHHDARPIWHGLTRGAGLVCVVVSVLAGLSTIAFVVRRGYGPARITAAAAVTAIIAGWGFAQRPYLLPGHLTIDKGAAGRPTLIALLVSLAIGAIVLVPSLALLFGLVLRGRFDPGTTAAAPRRTLPAWNVPLLPAAIACLAAGTLLSASLDSPWGRILGVPLLFGFLVLGFLWLAGEAARA